MFTVPDWRISAADNYLPRPVPGGHALEEGLRGRLDFPRSGLHRRMRDVISADRRILPALII